MDQNDHTKTMPDEDNFSSEKWGNKIPLQRRVYDFWLELKGERPWPSIKNLQGDKVSAFRPQSFLMDVRDVKNPTILYVGESFEGCSGGRPEKGIGLLSLGDASFFKQVCVRYTDVLTDKDLVNFEGVFVDSQSRGMAYYGCLLPMSDSDTAIDYIYGVIGWSDDTSMDQSVKDALENLLEECRLRASSLRGISGRSRDTLYDILSDCLMFYSASAHAPKVYHAILKKEKITAQRRAPMTPILKLILGKDFDKTRLTEYAAALSYATKSGINAKELPQFLKDIPGGIKGCVLAERAMRQKGIKKPLTHNLSLSAAENILKAQEANTRTQGLLEHAFDLVLARKGPLGETEILDVADVPRSVVRAAMIKAAKKQDI